MIVTRYCTCTGQVKCARPPSAWNSANLRCVFWQIGHIFLTRMQYCSRSVGDLSKTTMSEKPDANVSSRIYILRVINYTLYCYIYIFYRGLIALSHNYCNCWNINENRVELHVSCSPLRHRKRHVLGTRLPCTFT